jgi:hypothetical protein
MDIGRWTLDFGHGTSFENQNGNRRGSRLPFWLLQSGEGESVRPFSPSDVGGVHTGTQRTIRTELREQVTVATISTLS